MENFYTVKIRKQISGVHLFGANRIYPLAGNLKSGFKKKRLSFLPACFLGFSVFSIALFLLPLLALSQPVDVSLLKGIGLRSIGPAGMSGRVTSIDVVANDPNTIFIGTASGGLWKSSSGGVDWKSVFDEQPVNSIGAVAIQQSNPSVIWAGTGEGNPRNSHTSGAGIYKSLDGGITWKCMGLEATKTIHRIIIHRDNPDIVFVAAMGSIWGPNPERGVFRTSNGGKSWEKVLYTDEGTGCADLVTDPQNPNKLIAAMWEYGRKPWTFNSGGPGSGLYVSYDGGETWSRRTEKNGLPKGNLGRIGLSLAPSSPNVVYAIIESAKYGLYRSEDGGNNWTKTGATTPGNRPFYYADIFVDPLNENRIYSLHSIITVSEDGGASFKTFLPWAKVHPDHHAFWIHPHDPDFMIDGNDGGMAISHDRGATWRFVENLPLGQFYHVSYDLDTPYHVYGGMQDNGSWQGPAYTWKQGGIRNDDWRELYFGDGFDVVSQKGNSRYGYCMSQGGNVARFDLKTGGDHYIKPIHPEGVKLRFNWNAAIAQDPFLDCGLYFGSQFVHYSSDCGMSWSLISPDLSTNDTTKQKQAISGGLTIDATQAENHTTILCISPSARDKNTIWVGTDDGNLQLTRDGGKTWNNLNSRLKGAPKCGWIPQIALSPHSEGEAFIILNNYRQNDWKPYLYHTTDFGANFSRIADENTVTGHCLSIVQDPIEANLLFLGTEQGLFFSIDKGKIWTKWTHNFPSVPVNDLQIHPREGDLIIGTFGRAIWIIDDLGPFRELAATRGEVFKRPFKVFKTPDAVLATFQSYEGTRFGASAHFSGDNRSRAARIPVYISRQEEKREDQNPKSEDKEENEKSTGNEGNNESDEGDDETEKNSAQKGKADKIKVLVRNLTGDTVRTFSATADTGLFIVGWDLSQNAEFFPTRNKQEPDAYPPGGMEVEPGTYEIVLVWGENRDSTRISVLPDPRIGARPDVYRRRKTLFAQQQSLVKATREAVLRLNEAMKIIDKVNDQLALIKDDSLKTALQKEGKSLKDSLNALESRFLEPKDFVGYDHVTERLTGLLWQAWEHILSGTEAPGKTAETALLRAEKELSPVLLKINALFNGKWKSYREQVEKIWPSPFEDLNPIIIGNKN